MVCEGGLGLNEARVMEGAKQAGLRVVQRLPVVGREGKPVLFAVYTLVHAAAADGAGEGEGVARGKEDGVGGVAAGAGVQPAQEPGASLVVRDKEGRRTSAYGRLMAEMGMPV